jgi:hypothetical protein
MQIFNTYQELIASEAYNANTCTVLAFGHSDEYSFGSEVKDIISVNSPLFRKPAIISQFLQFDGMDGSYAERIKQAISNESQAVLEYAESQGGIYVVDDCLFPCIRFISQPFYFGLIELDKEGKGILLTKETQADEH